eukprot:2947419-Rhodomonas_salina.1
MVYTSHCDLGPVTGGASDGEGEIRREEEGWREKGGLLVERSPGCTVFATPPATPCLLSARCWLAGGAVSYTHLRAHETEADL